VRPPNILVSREGHVKLCDFDNICSFGQQIQAANVPYYEQSENGSFGIAGRTDEVKTYMLYIEFGVPQNLGVEGANSSSS
jgi:serine/threonine protein kinase